MKRIYKRVLVVTLFFLLMHNAQSAVICYGITPPAGSYVISSKQTTLVPGVEETEVIYNTPDGSKPVSGFIVDINLGSSVNIMAASSNYNQAGTQTVKEMVKAAKNKTGRNIVAAINADLNWSGTGISNGPLIIDGNIYTDKPDVFFGIKKNGEAIIGDAKKYSEVKGDLVQAVRGMGWLVKDDKVVASSTDLAPRTAVGIKADGSVFFYVVEGRMFPRSVGISLKDLAEIMHSYGAVMALNMDGGGSTTYLAKREGEANIELRNIPSDGTERPSISSLLVYAESGDGTFHHAAITTEGEIYTPNSEVQFMARGVDSAGGLATLPEGLSWRLVDERFGLINNTGKFLSNGTEGKVIVNLYDTVGRKVGEGSIEIRTPDNISFKSNEFSLGFGETTDFGIRVTYQQRPVIFKDGDIIWEFDEKLGVFDNNLFTSNLDETVNGLVKASIRNSDVSNEFDLVVGKLPIVIFDFENNLINDKWKSSSVNGAKSNISVVHRNSGEPVRFGNQSLRMDFDFTPQLKNPGGAYAGFTDRLGLEELGVTFELPGSPTAIGMWVYGTEEAQGIWLRTGIGVNGTTAWKAFDLATELGGIDWKGWKYVEVDLTDFGGPYTILPGEFIRLMVTANSFGSQPLRPVGNIYIDNITVTYGTNPEDHYAPIIDTVKVNDKEIQNEEVINTNNITIETSFYEYEDKYATGIDFENVSIYVDGVNYLKQDGYDLNITDGKAYLQNVNLIDGIHEIKVVVIDNAGNEAVKSSYITVSTGTNNMIYLEGSDKVILGNDFILQLKADEINNIESVNLSLQISRTLSNFEVEFSEAFDGEVEYLNGVSILKISADRINESDVDYVFKITVPIDNTLSESAVVSYRVNIGEFKYIEDSSQGIFLRSFSSTPKNLSIAAPLMISSNTILVGQDGIFYVTDNNGTPVQNAEVFLITPSGDKQSLGLTNVEGSLTIDNFLDEVISFTLVAQYGNNISFEYKGQSFDSVGDKNGIPYIINSNGVQSPEGSKNITWLSNALANNDNAFIQYALKSEYEVDGESSFIQKQGNSSLYAFNGSQNINENYSININSVVVDNLLSGNEYVYRVGNGEYWSELRTFKTVYKNSDVNFLILGDIQTTDFEGFKNNLNKIKLYNEEYDFAIQVGDLVDDAGVFNHWSEILSTISNSFIGDLDIVHVLGNHEYYGDTYGEKADALFNLPDSNNNYYSTEYGSVYVAVINYTMVKSELREALDWLVEDANKSQAKWRILVTHQPPYYTNPQGNNDIFNELVPEYAERAGIDFVFSGHDHAYARTKPLINGLPDENGIVYIVTGAVGEKRYTAVKNPSFYFDELIDSFDSIYLSVEANETTFKIVTREIETGEIIDSYVKIKNNKAHNYYLVDGRLICHECNYSRSMDGYIGFVKTPHEDTVYLINKEFYKGLLVLGDDIYYFDKESGFAFKGYAEVMGLETIFDEEGRFISGGTGFVKEGNSTFYYQDLVIYKNGWINIYGSTYYFSTTTGQMRTGKTNIGGVLYEFTEDGRLIKEAEIGFIETEKGIYYVNDQGIKVFGWQEINGSRYYFSTTTGYMRTGKTNIGGVLYEFTEDGRLIKEAEIGFIETEEGIYYVNKNGLHLYGWQEIEGATYYFSTTTGYMRTGITNVGGILYEFAEDGKLIGKLETGFVETEEGTYYVNRNGLQLYGWQDIEGATYYFSTTTGYMRIGITNVGGILYEFAEDGRLIRKLETGFVETEEGTYYVNRNGLQLYGWQEIEEATYYFSTITGYMRIGITNVGGILYEFTEDGKLIGKLETGFIETEEGTYYVNENAFQLYGWQEIGGETYYFSTTTGYMRTGRTNVGGNIYEFTEDGRLIGKLKTGFIEIEEGTYYLNKNGFQLYGWQEIGGATYYFSTTTGYMRTGRTNVGGKIYDFTNDGKLIGEVELH